MLIAKCSCAEMLHTVKNKYERGKIKKCGDSGERN
jgi:hypothetical protein